jgi:cysteine-rich repeat protein
MPDLSQSGLDYVLSLAAGPVGSVYLAGSDTDNVVQLLPDGTTTVIIDATGDGAHPFDLPEAGSLAVDASGTVYVTGIESDNAFKIVPPGPFELSSAEQKCVNALNKGLRKVSRAQAREFLGCERDESQGDLGAMTIEECVAADRKEKVAKATSKVSEDGARNCDEVSPPFGANSASAVNTAARDSATALTRDLFGADLDAAVVPDESATQATARCQAAVAKSLARCADTHLKEFAKCKKSGLKNGSIITPGGIVACIADDPDGRIATACAPNDGKIRGELDSQCAGVDFSSAFPGRCAAGGSAAGVAQCLDEAARCRACRAAKNADGLLADCDTLDDGQANQSCVLVCGDGILEGGEACDDGNVVSEDGCSATCQVESCGDGTLQAGLGEECDDGNLDNLDGCTAACIDEFCGDGVANDLPNEQCDGTDDGLCPGSCQPDCACSVPITLGIHQCRPAAASVLSYYDSPTAQPIDSAIVDGILEMDCGQVDELTGRSICTCELTAPLMATGLLTICLNPTGESCAAGEIDCDGGDPLDVSLTSEHDIGSCSGHGDCATQCDSHCAGLGAEAVEARCEGYCVGGANNGMSCTGGSACPGGNCFGWTPNGNTVMHPDVCGCHCREVGGSAGSSGALACQVAVELVVEQFPPCGDGDDFLRLGRQCLQLTSEQTEVTLLETELGTIGPISLEGTPKACLDLAIAGPRDLSLAGSINTFHGNLEQDVADLFHLVCE